jgi:hypothetical protein
MPTITVRPSVEAQEAASPPFCKHARPQQNCFFCWREKKGRWAPPAHRRGVDTGSPKRPSNRLGESQSSDTVFRRLPIQVESGRARRSGRPRVPVVVKRRKALERDRIYRARKRAETAGDMPALT